MWQNLKTWTKVVEDMQWSMKRRTIKHKKKQGNNKQQNKENYESYQLHFGDSNRCIVKLVLVHMGYEIWFNSGHIRMRTCIENGKHLTGDDTVNKKKVLVKVETKQIILTQVLVEAKYLNGEEGARKFSSLFNIRLQTFTT